MRLLLPPKGGFFLYAVINVCYSCCYHWMMLFVPLWMDIKKKTARYKSIPCSISMLFPHTKISYKSFVSVRAQFANKTKEKNLRWNLLYILTYLEFMTKCLVSLCKRFFSSHSSVIWSKKWCDDCCQAWCFHFI